MKNIQLISIVIISVILIIAGCSSGKYTRGNNFVQLEVKFTDSRWDGLRIPDGEGCKRFKENGSTPSLLVTNIPPKANAIIMEYSDLSYEPMNYGGHGIIGYRIEPGVKEVIIPPVPGHTFELPEKFFLVSAHRKPSYGEGAYLPPCSGRGGNRYAVKVKAVYDASIPDEVSLFLGQGELLLGKDI